MPRGASGARLRFCGMESYAVWRGFIQRTWRGRDFSLIAGRMGKILMSVRARLAFVAGVRSAKTSRIIRASTIRQVSPCSDGCAPAKHRDNILNAGFHALGRIARAADGRVFFTQVFFAR